MRMFSTVLMIALLIGGAYGTLLLFHRLSGINMTEAACWSFRTRYFWVMPVWFLLYLWSFISLMFFLQKPYTLWNMNLTHTGALQGYAMSSEAAKLYDPVEKQYVIHEMQGTPPAATRFNETFRTVVMFKPFLSGEYQNMQHQSYWVSLIFLIMASLGVMVLYLFTYFMAGEYIKEVHLDQSLSNRMILDNFRQWTGYSLPLVLGAIVLFIIIISATGGAMANRIMGEYEERFGTIREDHQQEILSHAMPGRILKGMIVNRERDVETVYGRSDASSPDDEDQHIPTATYTIEFKGLIKYVPVYLGYVVWGEPDKTPLRKRLDQLFPPESSLLFETQRDREPREMRELDFLVNEDYSVSLVEEQR